jgi:peptide/nickel transport system permease protein
MATPSDIFEGRRDAAGDAVTMVEHGTTAPPAAPVGSGRRWRRLRLRPAAIAGLVGLSLVVAVALFAQLIAPHDPLSQNIGNSLAPPAWNGGSSSRLLGTDALGRDVLSRLLFGARASLEISASAAAIGAILGLVLGSIAGFFGGWIDTILMRIGDIQLSFPFILLAIAILGVIPDRTPIDLILVLGIPGWIIYARVVRSRVVVERRKDYILAARSIGASPIRILARYVLPSVWQVVPAIALLDLGFLVIVESTLSFLGFGLTPPAPSWGSILADGRQYMVVSPWLPIFPGLAIAFTVLSINLAADGLTDLLDPKLNRSVFRRQILRLPIRHAPPEPSARPAPLLRVQDLVVDFPFVDRVVHAVRGVSFDLERGQTIGIVGESGSGKSAMALSLIQLLDAPGRVTKGEILFDGLDLARASDRQLAQLRGKRIGMIFQDPTTSLNPVLTVGFQLVETLRQNLGVSPDEARDQAQKALRLVGIGDAKRVLRRYPFQLSGGMNQRVMIALAMTCRPDLLLADEPTTALDVTTQAQILDQLREIIRGSDTSLVLITHDIALVSAYVDVVLVMYAGRVCELGSVGEVIDAPKHPYTRALLGALPRVDMDPDARLEAIPGELPDPTNPPPGCPFAPRCPLVMDVCRAVDPELVASGASRRVACHAVNPRSQDVVP